MSWLSSEYLKNWPVIKYLWWNVKEAWSIISSMPGKSICYWQAPRWLVQELCIFTVDNPYDKWEGEKIWYPNHVPISRKCTFMISKWQGVYLQYVQQYMTIRISHKTNKTSEGGSSNAQRMNDDVPGSCVCQNRVKMIRVGWADDTLITCLQDLTTHPYKEHPNDMSETANT